jgi:hypothetical protein
MRRFITGLKPNQMFFTRDCLDFGQRDTIDKILSRWVIDKTLVRLARGCFMVNKRDAVIPTIDQIAEGKANAFKRRIFVHGVTALKEFFTVEKSSTENVYAIDGATSSFGSIHGRIYFKAYAPRKLSLGDTPVGLAIRALWHHRHWAFAWRLWNILRLRLHRTEREQLRNSCAIMPAWLVDIVVYGLSLPHEVIPPDLEDILSALRPKSRQPNSGG